MYHIFGQCSRMKPITYCLLTSVGFTATAQIEVKPKYAEVDTIAVIRNYKHIDSLMPEKLKSKLLLAKQDFILFIK